MIVDTHKILFIIFLTIFIYHLNIKLLKFNNKIFDEHQNYLKFNFRKSNRWIYYFFIHTFF